MTGRIGSLAAVMLAAAILYGMQRTTPLYSDITSPVPVRGRQGELLDTGAFRIGIADVHVARQVRIAEPGGARNYTTSGVWVVVEAGALATRESLSLASAHWLGPSGRRYALSGRLPTLPGMAGTEQLEPGIPRPVLMAFEVPESELSGATLLVSRTAFTPLLEEAWIEMSEMGDHEIRSAVALGRGTRLLPWTLEVE